MADASYIRDLYRVLGVPTNATQEEIKTAYRLLARRLHPDYNKSPGAVNQFKDVSAANAVLGDPTERRKYDTEMRAHPQKPLLMMRVTASRQAVLPIDEPQIIYVLAEVMSELQQANAAPEVPLNLVLVLDRSTSMKKDGRQDRLKAAAYQIIDQLRPTDIFSVIAFSDDAEIIVPAAPLSNPSGARAQIAMMQAFGGTEILKGLKLGLEQIRRFASKQYINHIILLTDGRTYDDEKQSLELAADAAKRGIGISTMGLGDEWNDSFLDQLASLTGGTSEYINSPSIVARFLNDRVRALGGAYVERLKLSIAPDPDVSLDFAFRLSPNAQPVTLETDPVMLGSMQLGTVASTLLALQIGPLTQIGKRALVRLDITGDLIREQWFDYKLVHDVTIEVADQVSPEYVPASVVDALNRISFYRQQEKAEAAAVKGDLEEATRRLETLATHLLDSGHEDLAKEVMGEVSKLNSTNTLSDNGKKVLKYGTRLLIAARAGNNPNQEPRASSASGRSDTQGSRNSGS